MSLKRGFGWGIVGIGAWMAACRFIPGHAARWQAVAQPARLALHRLTAAVPFPVAEPLALMLPGLAVGRSGARRAARALLLTAWMYALLWYPAYWATVPEATPAATPAQLAALCDQLLDALSGASESPSPDDAGAVAGLEGAAVKVARYPEWMAALDVSGIFSPWTGEVLVDPAAPPALMPFTRVHELMHLRGIADEGAANIAAYEACMRAGGAWARSAQLWALRYALQRLFEAAPDAASAYPAPEAPVGSSPSPTLPARLLGIDRQTTDYAALADWLARAPCVSTKIALY